jgi:cell division protein FtsQ
MSGIKLNNKKLVYSVLWLLVGIGCITLLIAAINRKESRICNGVDITITGVSNNFFIDKNDVYAIIKNNGGDTTDKKSLGEINLKNIERELEKDVWIKNAELYFDNNNILKISVEEREPVARIFTNDGNTFYIDSSCKILPLSNKFSARVPIFTSFPNVGKAMLAKDSLLLANAKDLSIKIAADSFLMAMIEQVDVMPKNTFEFIPKVGRQKILFGNAEDADAKFNKLKLFYKNVIAQAGWNKYSVINLQYKNQVVATIKGAVDVTADSLRTLQLMQSIVENATIRSSDSSQVFNNDLDRSKTDSSLIEQSMEREDEGEEPVEANTVRQLANTAIAIPKPVVAKPTIAKPPSIPKKPVILKPATIAVTKPVTAVVAKPKPPLPKPKPAVVKPLPPKPKATMTKPAVKKKPIPT